MTLPGYIWIKLESGREVLRRISASASSRHDKRSDLGCPAIRSDTIYPTRSVADGVEYTSRSEYERSLKAGGYRILDGGEHPHDSWKPPVNDRKANRDAIERAICDVDAGRVPPVLDKLPV